MRLEQQDHHVASLPIRLRTDIVATANLGKRVLALVAPPDGLPLVRRGEGEDTLPKTGRSYNVSPQTYWEGQGDVMILLALASLATAQCNVVTKLPRRLLACRGMTYSPPCCRTM